MKFEILRFKETDLEEIVNLFYETVHAVNSKDYTEEQVNAWAPRDEKDSKMGAWKESLSRNTTFVANIGDKIVGFSDLRHDGYLDRLFVHKDYQGMGVAGSLVSRLEEEAMKFNLPEIDTEASITAKPFFERQGYIVVKEQTVEIRGVKLTNYKMIKRLR
ncbi:GNAT family N-acetyltransferase [Paenibacillus sp. FSL H7-0326]|uniref:GNAT family N-acetyltransferase n=1 Tax=Paenibacillus sp. FSL H7-0326 TaxID=1921144 RepID=UPI00096ECBAA|nr:GNAT family N-acetyltransferase [Paenibacillus sp. FSL H7-0326]OMC70624.1 GNAT family N-acetyltransferase [Paenibacillus sp. FSL H7-0326]